MYWNYIHKSPLYKEKITAKFVVYKEIMILQTVIIFLDLFCHQNPAFFQEFFVIDRRHCENICWDTVYRQIIPQGGIFCDRADFEFFSCTLVQCGSKIILRSLLTDGNIHTGIEIRIVRHLIVH